MDDFTYALARGEDGKLHILKPGTDGLAFCGAVTVDTSADPGARHCIKCKTQRREWINEKVRARDADGVSSGAWDIEGR